MSDQPSTPPASREQVDEAVHRLKMYCVDFDEPAVARDVDVVAVEIARLRRHSHAFARLLRDLLPPVQLTATAEGDQEACDVLAGVVNHILTSPEELDLLATAILEAEVHAPFLT